MAQPYRIGVIGLLPPNDFDVEVAKTVIVQGLNSIALEQPGPIVIVSHNVGLGIPYLAFKEAKERNWQTVGIFLENMPLLPSFPHLDQTVMGNDYWGDEDGENLIARIDHLVTVGKAPWIDDYVATASMQGIPVTQLELPTRGLGLVSVSNVLFIIRQEGRADWTSDCQTWLGYAWDGVEGLLDGIRGSDHGRQVNSENVLSFDLIVDPRLVAGSDPVELGLPPLLDEALTRFAEKWGIKLEKQSTGYGTSTIAATEFLRPCIRFHDGDKETPPSLFGTTISRSFLTLIEDWSYNYPGGFITHLMAAMDECFDAEAVGAHLGIVLTR